jgi:hypothetical protein
MFNPIGPDYGSYVDLRRRVFRRMQAGEINYQIETIVQRVFENVIHVEGVVLSRAERKRLYSQVFKDILEDMLKNLDGDLK